MAAPEVKSITVGTNYKVRWGSCTAINTTSLFEQSIIVNDVQNHGKWSIELG